MKICHVAEGAEVVCGWRRVVGKRVDRATGGVDVLVVASSPVG